MGSQSYQVRRLWKLRAVKAFARQNATQGFAELRAIIGKQKLDALFNEGFDLHAGDPEQGARFVRATLHERYAEDLQNIPKFRRANTRHKR